MIVCSNCGLEHEGRCSYNDVLENEEDILLQDGPLAGVSYPSRPKNLPRILMIGRAKNGHQDVFHYTRTREVHDGLPVYQFKSYFRRIITSIPIMNEDLWMAELDGKYAAEVGAWDGIADSPTYALERRGWSVLCVEPNPEMKTALETNRQLVSICACGENDVEDQDFHIYGVNSASYSSLRLSEPRNESEWAMWRPDPDGEWTTVKVPVRRLTRLLEEAGFPKLDALSVDTEGTELDVLKGLDFDKYRPTRIVCEAWTDDEPCLPFLLEKGYRMVERRDVNLLFELK